MPRILVLRTLIYEKETLVEAAGGKSVLSEIASQMLFKSS
jgi:hypothetical protein